MTVNVSPNFADFSLPLDRPFARRQPWVLESAAGTLAIRPVDTALAAAESGPSVFVGVNIGEDRITIQLSQNALALFCARREPALDWQAVDVAIRPIVLECLIQEFLDRFENILGARISIVEIVDDAPAGYVSRFACDVSFDGLTVLVQLNLPGRLLEKLNLWQASLPPAMPSGLTVPVHIRKGTALLTRAELRSLNIGDAIVLDTSGDTASAWAITGERYLSGVFETENGFQLLEALLSLPSSSMRHLMSTSNDEDHLFQSREGSINDIPIRLAFDVGRVEVPLSKLEGIAVGHVFDVGRHPLRGVDIVAQGKIIGQGEIVTVEGLTAVRITALNP